MNDAREFLNLFRQPRQYQTWDARRIRALREHLKLTQNQMAHELQVRQQTISEWETGVHRPHRSTQKVLSMVAERSGFVYEEDQPREQSVGETDSEAQ